MFLSIYFLLPTMVGDAADDGRHQKTSACFRHVSDIQKYGINFF